MKLKRNYKKLPWGKIFMPFLMEASHLHADYYNINQMLWILPSHVEFFISYASSYSKATAPKQGHGGSS